MGQWRDYRRLLSRFVGARVLGRGGVVLAPAYLVDGSYTPFLYFRF